MHFKKLLYVCKKSIASTWAIFDMANPNIVKAGEKTRFGQPGGNKPNPGGFLGGGKTMRQRLSEIMNMDIEEMKSYAADEKNPAVLRKAAKILSETSNVKELVMAVDMIESRPAQVVEQKNTNISMTQDEFVENVKKAANEV